MKNLIIGLTVLLSVSFTLSAPAAELDKNSFNLIKVNKDDFMLCEKLPNTVPPIKVETTKTVNGQPKIEPQPIKVETTKTVNGQPKIEPQPTQTNLVYTDSSGNIRKKAEDGGVDWYWSSNNGGLWWRSANGPAQFVPAQNNIPQKYCPPGLK